MAKRRQTEFEFRGLFDEDEVKFHSIIEDARRVAKNLPTQQPRWEILTGQRRWQKKQAFHSLQILGRYMILQGKQRLRRLA